MRRPVAVFAAAAAAVPSVIGGWAWLLAPADTPPPPVVTDSPTTVTTTTLPPPDAMGRIATIVSEGDAELVGANPSLVVGADGLPMVMYTVGEEIGDSSRETVLLRPKLVRCLDTACTATSTVELAASSFIAGEPMAVAFDQRGSPIVAFINVLVGRFRAGLAHVNIWASVVFAGLSGSAVADTSAPDVVTPRLIGQNARAAAVYQRASAEAS